MDTPMHTPLQPTTAPTPTEDAPRNRGNAVGLPRDATYRKEILYDRETRDYACYLDGELVFFARTYQEAESTLDQLVFELLSGQYFRETRG
jgi:hypothetical protein